MFIHQPFGYYRYCSGTEGRFMPSEPLPIDLFLTAGTPSELLKEYANLTGFPSEMPPLAGP